MLRWTFLWCGEHIWGYADVRLQHRDFLPHIEKLSLHLRLHLCVLCLLLALPGDAPHALSSGSIAG